MPLPKAHEPLAAQPAPSHLPVQLPSAPWKDDAGVEHTLFFTKLNNLTSLRSVMPKLGYLLQQSEQQEGGSLLRLIGAITSESEPDSAAMVDQLMERLAEEVVQSGDEELSIALLEHVSIEHVSIGQRKITSAVLQSLSPADTLSLVLVVLRRDYAPFFSRRIARTNAIEKPIKEAAKAWLKQNGLDAIVSLATRRFSMTASGSPTGGSPTPS